MNLVPSFLHRHIAHRPNLVKVVDNIGWLFIDRILRMGIGLLVGVWITRYLGPKKFGLLSYATTFVALFAAIAPLGLNSIVVRDLVKEPEGANSTLGTAFVLQLIGGVVSSGCIIVSISFLHPYDQLVRAMVAILGVGLIFKASDVVKYWFEAQVQLRYTVWVENSIFLLMTAAKIVMILLYAPLIAFVWIVLAEALLAAIGLFVMYAKKIKDLQQWMVNIERAKTLLHESWPLIFMGLMLGVYTKIDILMVEYFLGLKATGIYSAAVKISESWLFVSVVLVNSLYLALIKADDNDSDDFEKKIVSFYSIMFWFPFAVSFLLTLSTKFIFTWLYGPAYISAIPIFKLYVWSSIFVFVITASSRWYLIKKYQIGLLYRALFGAILNVVLNYILLRSYGTIGAAAATFITYFFVAYVYDFFDKNARRQLAYKFIALICPYKILGGFR